MRHYQNIHADLSRSDRIARLFELHHQQARQAIAGRYGARGLRLPATTTDRIRERAIASLRQAQEAGR